MTGSERDGDDPGGDGLASNRQATVDPDDDYTFEALGPWPRWRRSRPFWGGLLVLLAATEILLSERAPVPVVIHVGMQGLAGYLVPIILLLCGLLILFSPAQRTFYSVLAVLLSLGSWVTSNLGGFFVGMALGVVGGSLAFAWTRLSDNVPAPQLQAAPRREQLPPRLDQPAALDLLLGDPEEEQVEDTKPIGDKPPLPEEPPIRIDVPSADEPPIRIDVPSPEDSGDQGTGEQKTGDQEPGEGTPPGSGPGARRGQTAGPLGPACL